MSDPILPPDEHERLVEDLKPVVQAAARPRPDLRRQPWFWCLIVGALVGAAAYIVLWVHSDGNARDAAAARTKAVAAQSQAAEANGVARALASQVRQLGGVPVATPSPGAAGPRGAAGERGDKGDTGSVPSAAQVKADIRAVCTATPTLCQAPISLARLRAAVSACFAADQCPAPSRGPRGPTGATGPSGAAGATGPGPSNEQVADGINDWCGAHNGCTGPAGPKGDTGEQGDPGVGITSIDCTGLGIDSLTIHLSNGTTQTVPCNVTPSSGAPS